MHVGILIDSFFCQKILFYKKIEIWEELFIYPAHIYIIQWKIYNQDTSKSVLIIEVLIKSQGWSWGIIWYHTILNPFMHSDAKLHLPGWFPFGCGYEFASKHYSQRMAYFMCIKRQQRYWQYICKYYRQVKIPMSL